MLNAIQFKFGRGPGSQPEEFEPTPVNVFVGPNNSGKSKLLTEIHRYCSNGKQDSTDRLLHSIRFRAHTNEDAAARIARVTLAPRPTESLPTDHTLFGKLGQRISLPKHQVFTALIRANENPAQYCAWYLRLHVLILNGHTRIALVQPKPAGDLKAPPENTFQALFIDDMRRAEVRRIVHEAFGDYFVLDPTELGTLRARMSTLAPSSSLQERGIHDEAVQFHKAAMPIELASDGVKAFCGIITEVIAGDPDILLIDEPEAFLHPSLAFKLGYEIARVTSGSDKRLFVSTHSSHFVMGCIQSGSPVTIIRLTYRDGVATARRLVNTELLRLMRNPLLRSTGVMAGLFYECVVVTESDTDRAFYQELNERLLRADTRRGIPNCLFIHAQNKQTIQTILGPLRDLGIPTAAIVDVDILKEGGKVWGSFLEAAGIPEIDRRSLATAREEIKARCDATNKDMKRDGGISILTGSDKEASANLIARLREYGLFVVPGGELESWLSHLGTQGHGPAWLISMFEKLGEDPAASTYVTPTSGDVWAFMDQIRAWLRNPDRKGIPE